MTRNTSVEELKIKIESLKLEMAAYKRGVKSLLQRRGRRHLEIGAFMNMEERKLTLSEREKNLRLQKELLESILNNIPLMIVFLDFDCRIGWVNRTWEQKLGWSLAEVRDANSLEIMQELYPDPAECHAVFNCIHNSDGIWREFKTRVRNGTVIDTRWTNVKLSDGTIIGIGEDISERKQEEKERQDLKNQFLHAQKMEAIGALAGGIAHDFNNLLFPILGFSEMLKEDLSASDPLQANVDQILTATQRATELVRQILTFSRNTDHEIRPLKIQSIVKEVLKLSRSTLPATIEIVQDIDADCGFVLAEPSQIHQILMNLITNAFHAMENSGGVLTISIRGVHHSGECRLRKRLENGMYLKLTVKDTGAGIKADILERIYDPYFTTKPIGKGTGLGLPVVHGIVKNLEGEIFVESVRGKGTRFDIYLPQYEPIDADSSGNEKDTDVPLSKGNERILLIDDDAPILDIEKRMLEKLGYQVETCQRSMDALEMFRADPHAFDLVLTDMTMPQMTGDRLAKACMEIRADIPVVLCTGFSERMNKIEADELAIKGFLYKPFIQSKLAKVIREVFNSI